MPTFSNPTEITNPLFPVSDQASVLLLGHVDGKPFRTEVTLLPYTRIVEWEGQRVETLVSQYNAFLGGSIEEVAYDLYAQADDGSVWYFGEDVFDFRDGAIVSTEGTWLAGRDGPAAMIMPGDPKVGDVYRTENAPGFVFEEVTVRSTDQTLDGPSSFLHSFMAAMDAAAPDRLRQRSLFAAREADQAFGIRRQIDCRRFHLTSFRALSSTAVTRYTRSRLSTATAWLPSTPSSKPMSLHRSPRG